VDRRLDRRPELRPEVHGAECGRENYSLQQTEGTNRVENAADAKYHRADRHSGSQIQHASLVGAGQGDEQSFGFTWLRSQSATDRATIRNDDTFPDEMPVNGQVDRLQGIQYTERSLDARQLTWKRKWDWAEVDIFGSHNLVRQYDPDTRRFKSLSRIRIGHVDFKIEQATGAQGVYNASRIWRDLHEDNSHTEST